MRLMSWPDGECYLRPPQSLVASLLSLAFTPLFSRTGGVLSHQNSSDTQVPSISTEELVLPRHARCVLSRLRLAESRILPTSPVDARLTTPLISFCTVQVQTLCAAPSFTTFCLSTTSVLDPGDLPGFWGSMVFRYAPIPRKGFGNQQQQQRNFKRRRVYCHRHGIVT